MTSEARLEELAAMLANHPFLGMAVDEINRLEAEAAEAKLLREDLQAVEGMLKSATDGWGEEKVKNADLRIQLRDESYLADELKKRVADFARAQARAVKQRNEAKRRLEGVLALIENTPSGIWRLDMSNISQKIDTTLSKEKPESEES